MDVLMIGSLVGLSLIMIGIIKWSEKTLEKKEEKR